MAEDTKWDIRMIIGGAAQVEPGQTMQREPEKAHRYTAFRDPDAIRLLSIVDEEAQVDKDGFEIYEDELYPRLFINKDEDGSYVNGPCHIPLEFISEYERVWSDLDRIQEQLSDYLEKAQVERTRKSLCKYVDGDVALKMATRYTNRPDIIREIEKKREEIIYSVFESRMRLSGTFEDKRAAVDRMLREWIRETYVI